MGRVFLFGGLMGIKRRRRETTIAEGKKPLTTRGYGGGFFCWGGNGELGAEGAKLRLPKARSLSRLGGMGECRKLPQRGLGRSPRNRDDFEHFKPKYSTFLDPGNLTFLNN